MSLITPNYLNRFIVLCQRLIPRQRFNLMHNDLFLAWEVGPFVEPGWTPDLQIQIVTGLQNMNPIYIFGEILDKF